MVSVPLDSQRGLSLIYLVCVYEIQAGEGILPYKNALWHAFDYHKSTYNGSLANKCASRSIYIWNMQIKKVKMCSHMQISRSQRTKTTFANIECTKISQVKLNHSTTSGQLYRFFWFLKETTYANQYGIYLIRNTIFMLVCNASKRSSTWKSSPTSKGQFRLHKIFITLKYVFFKVSDFFYI